MGQMGRTTAEGLTMVVIRPRSVPPVSELSSVSASKPRDRPSAQAERRTGRRGGRGMRHA
jgi:hypothetical protein